jgi:5-hydroxyisourate hydrolase-like protein (transthyretin family)
LLHFLILAALVVVAIPSSASAGVTPGDINGTITEGGTGVSGLTVAAYAPGQDPLNTGYYQGYSAEVATTAGGAYDLSGLAPGTYTVLAVPADTDGYVATYSNGATTDAAASTVTLTAAGINLGTTPLVKGGTISGTITSPSGAGVPQITVYIEDAGADKVQVPVSNGEGAINKEHLEAITGNGTYSISGLPPGTYYVFVEGADDYVDNYASVWYGGSASEEGATPVTVTAGSDATVNQALSPAGAISGSVELNGSAFTAEGTMYLYDAAGDELTYTQISGTGSYTFARLAPGTYYLDFEPGNGTGTNATEYAEGWYNGTGLAASQSTATAISVSAGASVTTTLSEVTGGTISGTVTAYGSPASGVVVELYDTQNRLIGTVSTGEDGAYSIGGDGTYLVPGTYKVAFVSGATDPADGTSDDGADLGFQYYKDVTTLAGASAVTVAGGGANTPGINATLSTGGTITGTVTDAATGGPAPEVLVLLEDSQGNVLDEAASKPDGTYTLPGIPTGSYYVEFLPIPGPLEGDLTNEQTQYYGGKQILNGSTAVSVTGGQTSSGINAALSAASTPGQMTTVTTSTPTAEPTSTAAQDTAITTQTHVPADAALTLTATVPRISGTIKVGDKLTAEAVDWTAGTTFSYQWYSDGKAINGATSSTFRLAAAEYKKAITVAVTGKKPGYKRLTETSLKSKAVAEGTLRAVAPKITGTMKLGDDLAAETGTWTKGTKFTYQWYANNEAINTATTPTLTLAAAEEGKTILLKVTGKLAGYKSTSKTTSTTKRVAG